MCPPQASANVSLIAASRACDPEAIRSALAEGADPDAKNLPASRSCLHYVVDGDYASMANEATPSVADRILCCRLLLDAGANPNATHRSLPVLHASVDTPECARLLLFHGADPHAKSSHGMSALMHASLEHAHPDSFRLIAAAGADPRALDDDGFDAIVHALRSGNLAVLGILEELGVAIDFADPASLQRHFALAEANANPQTIAWLRSRGERAIFNQVLSTSRGAHPGRLPRI